MEVSAITQLSSVQHSRDNIELHRVRTISRGTSLHSQPSGIAALQQPNQPTVLRKSKSVEQHHPNPHPHPHARGSGLKRARSVNANISSSKPDNDNDQSFKHSKRSKSTNFKHKSVRLKRAKSEITHNEQKKIGHNSQFNSGESFEMNFNPSYKSGVRTLSFKHRPDSPPINNRNHNRNHNGNDEGSDTETEIVEHFEDKTTTNSTTSPFAYFKDKNSTTGGSGASGQNLIRENVTNSNSNLINGGGGGGGIAVNAFSKQQSDSSGTYQSFGGGTIIYHPSQPQFIPQHLQQQQSLPLQPQFAPPPPPHPGQQPVAPINYVHSQQQTPPRPQSAHLSALPQQISPFQRQPLKPIHSQQEEVPPSPVVSMDSYGHEKEEKASQIGSEYERAATMEKVRQKERNNLNLQYAMNYLATNRQPPQQHHTGQSSAAWTEMNMSHLQLGQSVMTLDDAPSNAVNSVLGDMFNLNQEPSDDSESE